MARFGRPAVGGENYQLGARGATSNPIIISDLLKSGRFDAQIEQLIKQGSDDEAIAWQLTDQLVREAQRVFLPVWERTGGNDGYVSFELNPLLEDPDCALTDAERVAQYIELGQRWSAGHANRMIKVPATPAGLASLEALCAAAGVTLNVTLIFSERQYEAARDAVWRGAQRRKNLDQLQERVQHLRVAYRYLHRKTCSSAVAGGPGTGGHRQCQAHLEKKPQFWSPHPTPLQQEIIFASTGTRKPADEPWKYVAAFAGSDIQTNPPATNAAVEASGLTFERQVDQTPAAEVLDEIDSQVDFAHLERVLMEEGIKKFADPQKALLALIAEKRGELAIT